MAGRTVHIGNVSNMMSEEHLKGYFSCAGAVQQLVIAGDPYSPVRFAFVEYATEAEAQNAINFLNGTPLAGLFLRVQMAKNPIKRTPSQSTPAHHRAPQQQQHQQQLPHQQPPYRQRQESGSGGSGYDPLSSATTMTSHHGPEQGSADSHQQEPFSAIKQFQEQQEIDRELISRTIYVSGIDSSLLEQTILEFFQVCGPISNYRLCGDPNQVSRFAFIEFASAQSASSALALHGSMLGRTQLRIVPSKAPIQVPQSMQDLNHEEKQLASKTIHVGGVDLSVTDRELKDFFEPFCGPVVKIALAGESEQHATRFAFVEFLYQQSADNALQLNGVFLKGHMLRINPSRTPILSGGPRHRREQHSTMGEERPHRRYSSPTQRRGTQDDRRYSPDRRDRSPRQQRNFSDTHPQSTTSSASAGAKRKRDEIGKEERADTHSQKQQKQRDVVESVPSSGSDTQQQRLPESIPSPSPREHNDTHAPARSSHASKPKSSDTAAESHRVEDEDDFSEPDDDDRRPQIPKQQQAESSEPSSKRKKLETSETNANNASINLDDYFV